MRGYGEPRQRFPRCDESIASRQMTNHMNGQRCETRATARAMDRISGRIGRPWKVY